MSHRDLDQLQTILYNSVNKIEGKTCLAFSGGVDSSLLARLLDNWGFDYSLVSISFEIGDESKYIREVAEEFEGDLYFREIPPSELERGLITTLETIEYERIALLENALGYYFIFKLAASNGFSTVLSAHGVDELFCGYDVYRREYGKMDLPSLIDELTRIAIRDNQIIEKIADLFNVSYHCPFLEDEFIEYSKTIPLDQKILDENDKLRKHYIREQASDLSLPVRIAYRKKSSLQYSSGLHKSLRRLSRENGYSNKKGRKLGYESGMMAYILELKKDLSSEY
ncbi:hypothetical protein GF326_12680 [Candidatus Bathyarchaeota archaeon]|nr:hypothetical protein [Candidatus Bathyarchaeota archaeon]